MAVNIDFERIINGEPLPIAEVVYPLNDMGEGFQWYMRQPTDYEYDLSIGVGEAAEADMRAQPEVKSVAKLPPTQRWIDQQNEVRAANEQRMAELLAKPMRTPEEEVDLDNRREYLKRLVDPHRFTRADEIARRAANRARDTWLLRRLVVDKHGNMLFDPNQQVTDRRWRSIGRSIQTDLITPLYKVLFLIQTAKNSSADQNLS